MDNYTIVTGLPLTGYYFAQRDKKSTRKFWKDILANKSKRSDHLRDLVHQDPEYANLKFDYTIDSLVPLGEWMKKNVTTEPKPKELYDLEARMLGDMDTPTSYILSSKTRSICLDVSLYYGDIMLKELEDREWHIYTDTSNRNIDFGGMGIKAKYKNIFFYPLATVALYAINIIENRQNGRTLVSLLKTQSNSIIEIETNMMA